MFRATRLTSKWQSWNLKASIIYAKCVCRQTSQGAEWWERSILAYTVGGILETPQVVPLPTAPRTGSSPPEVRKGENQGNCSPPRRVFSGRKYPFSPYKLTAFGRVGHFLLNFHHDSTPQIHAGKHNRG